MGSYLVDELVAAGHQPQLLVRSGSEQRVRQKENCSIVAGEVGDSDSLRAVLTGCDAAIYNIGILREQRRQGITFQALQFEGAVRSIDLAGETGVRRFLLMSANGVKPEGTDYQRTKFRAEEHLRASALEHTIFRPSVIFGDPRGRMEFCSQLRDDMIRMPLPAPLFYEGLLPRAPGSFALAPVHIGDVAKAFVASLERPETYGQTYPLCGPEAISWKQIITTIAAASATKTHDPGPGVLREDHSDPRGAARNTPGHFRPDHHAAPGQHLRICRCVRPARHRASAVRGSGTALLAKLTGTPAAVISRVVAARGGVARRPSWSWTSSCFVGAHGCWTDLGHRTRPTFPP